MARYSGLTGARMVTPPMVWGFMMVGDAGIYLERPCAGVVASAAQGEKTTERVSVRA